MEIKNFTLTKKPSGIIHSMMESRQNPQRLVKAYQNGLLLFMFALIMVCASNPLKAQNDTILVDFGSIASPAKWNFISGYLSGGVQVLNNSKGEKTTIGLKVTSNFVNLNANGTASPDPLTGFPGTVTVDNFYSSINAMGALELNGLNPNRDYTFIVFASRAGITDNREAEYKFTGLTESAIYLDASNNTSHIVSTTLKPATDGTIKIKTSPGPNNTNGSKNYHLNAMKIIYPTPPPGEVVVVDPPNPNANPANPNANNKVKLILKYFASLKNRSDHRVISGQFMGYSQGVGGYPKIEQIHTNTGKYVGIVGSDYSTQPNDNSIIEYEYVNPGLIKAWNSGSLVALQLHLPNPTGGGLKEMINLNKVLDRTTDPVTYDRWFQEMDLIAAGLSQLQDNGVVVLFRPFHEMNGGWFWWGGSDTDKFKALWKQMFDYFTSTKKLNNLIWVFAPNRQNTANTTTPAPVFYYPGDEYVDITGLDSYTSTISTGGIAGYSAMVALGKPFGITEYGPESSSNPATPEYDYRLFVNSLKSNLPEVCFFMCWNANWGLDVNKYVGEALSDPYIANRDNLNWNQTVSISSEISSAFEAIRVCPNPFEKGSSLNLKLSGFNQDGEIRISIFDTLGKELVQQKFRSAYDGIYKVKNASSLNQGIYFLNVDSQTKSAKTRFVVK